MGPIRFRSVGKSWQTNAESNLPNCPNLPDYPNLIGSPNFAAPNPPSWEGVLLPQTVHPSENQSIIPNALLKVVVTILYFTLYPSCGGRASQVPKSRETMNASTPPRAKKIPHSITLHGVERHDPFAWLRDDNWQEVLRDPSKLDADIREYLEAENAYTEASIQHLKGLRETLYEEIKARIKEDDSSVPDPDGPFEYYRRFETGQEYPLYCRRQVGSESGEEIILNVNELARGKEFCRVVSVDPSPNHERLAYAVDFLGSEKYEIHFVDLASKSELPVSIAGTSGNSVWSSDSEQVIYGVLDDNHRTKWIKRHRLGEDPDSDPVVYYEPDDGFFTSVDESESREFIIIDSHDHTTSECQVIPRDEPATSPRMIKARESEVIVDLHHRGESFYLLVREGNQKDGRVVRTPVAQPGREHWEDVVPYTKGHLIEGITLKRDFFVRLETVNALPRIVIREFESGEEHSVEFDEEAYSLGLVGTAEFVTDTLRFSYSSPTTPSRVYDYNMRTRKRVLRKEQEIPSGHNPEEYVTRRISAPARDGEIIPVTLLYRNGLEPDGSHPVLLYGYGSYGISIPASFSIRSISLVDRGFVYAIAHIRGGKDKGYDWYESAKRENKQRTFSDFIDAGRALVERGWTRAGRIAAVGGSAGGMLMGVVANQAPDLFGAIVADVPFVDVLNTMSDKELPLTPPEWPEWGNPLESRDAYDTIAAYSPYENVTAQEYPALLVLAGLTDPRVTYWEPAKWVARLREVKSGESPLYLKTEMEAGHAGASGRFEHLKRTALIYAFLIDQLGSPD